MTWRDNYNTVRAEAQKKADESGFDFGIERDAFGFRCFMLPRRENRYGFETRCEVVSPSRLEVCQPGHGPKNNAYAKCRENYQALMPRVHR